MAQPGAESISQSRALVADIAAALASAADPSRAAPMRAYMRGQFAFFGIPTPRRRALTLPLLRAFQPESPRQLTAAARMLWRKPEREFQYVAVDLLNRYRIILSPGELFPLLELAGRKPWWDSVDPLAVLLGSIVRRFPSEGSTAMDQALGSEDFWLRRVAMLHQLGWRGQTDTARLLAYAERLGPEKEFFIRKAIGWALRDYARHDPATVQAFLSRSANRFSALTLREAGRHLESHPANRGASKKLLRPR